MNDEIDRFVTKLLPILEQESGLVWGERGVKQMVKWTLDYSRLTLIPTDLATELKCLMDNLRKLQDELCRMLADGRATANEAATWGAEIEYLQRALDISREIMRRDDDE